MSTSSHIRIKNVSLVYDLYKDRSDSFKEWVVNTLHRRKYFDTSTERVSALNGVSLDIKHGERVGVIGLNGSGKSTLLKVISGILKPTAGSVSINGTIQPLIEVGAGFNPEFSGRENIYLNGYMLGFNKKEIQAAEQEIVHFTDIGDFIDVPVKYYSSGMSMRLAFTIATMIRPEILVFDEMLSTGDAQFLSKARKRMDQLVNSAKILVLVSHDISLVKSITNRTIVLEKGTIKFDGPTDEAIKYYMKSIQDSRTLDSSNASSVDPSLGFSVSEIPPHAHLLRLPPLAPIVFNVKTRLDRPFDKLFVNVHVMDESGQHVMHLRNDWAGSRFEDMQPGSYDISIRVESLPLASGHYYYQYRIVGHKDGIDSFLDTTQRELEVSSGLDHHCFVNQTWSLQRI